MLQENLTVVQLFFWVETADPSNCRMLDPGNFNPISLLGMHLTFVQKGRFFPIFHICCGWECPSSRKVFEKFLMRGNFSQFAENQMKRCYGSIGRVGWLNSDNFGGHQAKTSPFLTFYKFQTFVVGSKNHGIFGGAKVFGFPSRVENVEQGGPKLRLGIKWTYMRGLSKWPPTEKENS